MTDVPILTLHEKFVYLINIWLEGIFAIFFGGWYAAQFKENGQKTIWSGDVGKSVSLEVNIG